MRFSLQPLVGFCAIGGRGVMLDVRQDRYWILPASTSAVLARVLAGAMPSAEEAQVLDGLAAAGLLCSTHLAPHDAGPLPLAEQSGLAAGAQARRLHVLSASLALASTMLRLKGRGLDHCVRRLLEARRRPALSSIDGIERHAAAFSRLRLFVTPNGRCLPLSLALATRCAAPQARLVFGVKLDPFAAHAWVQRDRTVLNDEAHVVRQFTPILVL